MRKLRMMIALLQGGAITWLFVIDWKIGVAVAVLHFGDDMLEIMKEYTK